ncbi:MAG TPA: IgGFc-binding protein, partial [Nannocystaceae bacterium]|nr:IgGFc-binding protein [Nannocystaceae bacterium]
TTGTTGEPPCPKDTVLCENNTAKVCDGMGGFSSETPCADECLEGKGCVLCLPGSVQCNGKIPEACNDNGDAWVPGEACDDLQGLACDPNQGGCAGACANLGLSYVGCDYYSTVTQQYDLYNTAPKDEFAIAVANTANQIAKVTVTQGANTVTTADVAANSVQIIKLPWVNALTKGTGPSVLVQDGAYRVRSTNPVTVYQFNPLKSTTTNDASLLLPVNTWRDKYMVASWPHWSGLPAFYAVVAQADGTKVTLAPSATGKVIQAGGGVAADGTGVVTLNEGDVLQVMTGNNGDVTGTVVTADKPIEVFGGHDCTNIPANVSACDHLEEAMFPVDTLAKEYIVVPPIQVPNNALDKAQMVRIVASEANTTLTFTPDQPVNKVLTNVGDFVQLSTTTAAFKVSADKKILVAQYMVGQSAGFGTSDPSMLLTVPTEQYRSSYLFYAEKNWTANFVDIIAPVGAGVQVDMQAVNSWKPIGATGYQVAHVPLSNLGDGTHRVTSDQKVGISVYGVQSAGSYWYPGGLDLDLIPQ